MPTPIKQEFICCVLLQIGTEAQVLPVGVTYVDVVEGAEPETCAENVVEIFVYLKELEKRKPVGKEFLKVSSWSHLYLIILVISTF